MQNTKRLTWLVIAMISLPICLGCGGEKYGMVAVQGQVTYKGQPLKYGDIAFRPLKTVQQGVPYRNGISRINSDGRYSLSTFKKDDGVMPGEYVVVVIYKEKPKPGDPYDVVTPSIIPERYTNPDKTPFKITVPDGKSAQTFDFKIEDK